MGDPMAMAGAIRKQIANLDPELPLTSIRSMEDIVGDSFAQRRRTLWLLGMFADPDHPCRGAHLPIAGLFV
jgi:hypothetical protein